MNNAVVASRTLVIIRNLLTACLNHRRKTNEGRVSSDENS